MATVFLTIVAGAGGLDAQPIRSAAPPFEVANGSLVAWVAARQHAGPNTLADFSTEPARTERFRSFVDALASSNWQQARGLAAELRYQVVSIAEEGTWFVVASDGSSTGRDPTIVLNPSPRRELILQAPHVPFEAGTGEQAVVLLRDLGGRAAIISGAHRCASNTFTACDGRTSVCGTSEGHRDSDVAHNPGTLFHTAHLSLFARWPSTIVVSLHGMRDDNDAVRTSLIASNGIRASDEQRATAATRFRLLVGQSIPQPGAVVSCNLPSDAVHGFRPPCGYTNVQGRHVNDDADVCRGSVERGTGRFIHLEQDWQVLGPYAQSWPSIAQHIYHGAIQRALDAVVPAVRRGP